MKWFWIILAALVVLNAQLTVWDAEGNLERCYGFDCVDAKRDAFVDQLMRERYSAEHPKHPAEAQGDGSR